MWGHGRSRSSSWWASQLTPACRENPATLLYVRLLGRGHRAAPECAVGSDGDTVGDGAAEQLGHGVVGFRGLEVQPVTVGVSHQQTLVLETEALYQRDGAGAGVLELKSGLVDQVCGDGAVDDPQNFARGL